MQRDATSDPILTGRSTEDLAQSEDRPPDAPAPDETPPPEGGRPQATATTEPAQQEQAAQPNAEEAPPLLTAGDAQDFRDRWSKIQSTFVDDPREAVKSADALVTDVMQSLATTFANQKRGLEGQWKSGEEANTEDLRKALRHYRSFFNRLLTT
ncbi:hypothetical protein ACFC4G_06465 [Streptomyces sp. NPDC056002]|uniref:hypothetical protein n=1 Tax=unclassified Streptomyces TaxID=2593676 RepID=UPI0035DC8121